MPPVRTSSTLYPYLYLLSPLYVMGDRASKALVEASLPGEPQTYDTRSKRSGVPFSTLYYRRIIRALMLSGRLFIASITREQVPLLVIYYTVPLIVTLNELLLWPPPLGC